MKSAHDIQQAIADLSYRDRRTYLAKLALEHRDQAGLQDLLDALEKGNVFQQDAGLFMAIVTRNSPRILRAVSSPSRTIRLQAAKAAIHLCQDHPDLIPTILQVRLDARSVLIKQVALSGNEEIAEQLWPELSKQPTNIATHLLACCGEKTVRKALTRHGHQITRWSAIFKKHPDIAASHVERIFVGELNDCSEDQRCCVWWRYKKTLIAMKEATPTRFLALLSTHCLDPARELDDLAGHLAALYREGHRDAVFKIISRSGSTSAFSRWDLPNAFIRNAESLAYEHVLVFCKNLLSDHKAMSELFKAFPYATRHTLFRDICRTEEAETMEWETDLLAVLPFDLRLSQTRMLLDKHQEDWSPNQILTYTSLLSYEEAFSVFETELRSSDVNRREAGYRRLIYCCQFNRAHFESCLFYLLKTGNERDGVRHTIFTSLSELPASMFQDERLATPLHGLFQEAHTAPDRSQSTNRELEHLSFKMLFTNINYPKHALFQIGLETLAKCANENGYLHTASPIDKDCVRLASLLFEKLRGPAVNAMKREDYRLLVQMTNLFGRSGWELDSFQSLVEQAITNASPRHARSLLASYWFQNPATRGHRIREWLKKDRSIIHFHVVSNHLHQRQQDWLAPFLTAEPIPGNYSVETTWIFPATGAFHRWPEKYQRQFARLLDRLVLSRPTETQTWEKRHYAKIRASLQVTQVEDLMPLISSDSPVVRDSALTALPEIDDSAEAVSVLLDHLRQTRTAVPALARCLRSGDTVQLETVLKSVLGDRTVPLVAIKAALELLPLLPSDRSFPIIKTQLGNATHRDVKISIGHALQQLIATTDDSWDLMAQLLHECDEEIALSFLTISPSRFSREHRQKYGRLLVPLATHPSRFVRPRFFENIARWSNGLEEIVATQASARLLDPSPGAEVIPAIRCLVEQSTKSDGVSVRTTLEALSNKPQETATHGKVDLPNYQRIGAVVALLNDLPHNTRMSLSRTLFESGCHLLEKPGLEHHGMNLIGASIKWDDVEDGDSGFGKLAHFLTSRQTFTTEFTSIIERWLQMHEAPLSLSDIALVDRFCDSTNWIYRLLGFLILKVIGTRNRWPERCAERLARFRQDDHPHIRRVSHSLFMRSE